MYFNFANWKIIYEGEEITKNQIIEIAAAMASISHGIHISASLNMMGYGLGFKIPMTPASWYDRGLMGLTDGFDVCREIITTILYPKQKLLIY